MKQLTHLATRFIGTPVLMHPPKMEVILKAFASRLGMPVDLSAIESSADAEIQRLMTHYQEASAGDTDYSVLDGVAIISIQGTLMKRCSGLDAMSGCCSYVDIENQLMQAMSDSNVRSVLLDIDSPGGEVSGCFELCDAIFAQRGNKPIYAVANDCALSAAYAIASSAEKIFVGRTGAVGSVGVFALHAEQAEFDKKMGVAYTYVFAGKNKVDGNPHSPLSDRAKAEIQTEVDREYGIFTETVSRNRGADVKDIVGTNARLLWADAAVPLLADEVGTFDDAMNALVSLGGKKSRSTNRGAAQAAAATPKGNSTMDKVLNPQASAPCEGDEEEMKGKGKKADTSDTDPADKKKDDNDGDDTEGKKAVAPATASVAAAPALPAPVAAASVVAAHSSEEITAIGNLCKMAGVADPIPYLTKKLKMTNGTERLMSVAEISNELAENRSAESGRTAVMNNVDTTLPGAGKLTMDRIQTEANAFARANRTTETGKLYGMGTRMGTTPEQAFAAALEANPEAYEQFRHRHNAKALISQLEAAGIKLQAA